MDWPVEDTRIQTGDKTCLQSVLSQNTIDEVAYKPQEFTSHSSRVWEVQDQGPGRGSGLVEACFLAHSSILLCPHVVGEGVKELSGVPFLRVLIPQDLITFQRPPPPNTISLGISASTYKFWEDADIPL